MKLKVPIQDKLIFLGVISAAYGIKGEVLIKAFNADPKHLPEMDIVDAAGEQIGLAFVRVHPKGGIVAKVDGCNSRTKAEQLAKTKLYCYRSTLPETQEDEFYITDLVGISVLNAEGENLGRVAAVHNFGAGDIIEIEFFGSNNKQMYPFTREFFPDILDDHIVADIKADD